MRTKIRLGLCGALVVLASGCPESKEPMHADNPNADPLMMDAGGPAPSPDVDAAAVETPSPAPSSS
jgi:hypothetical protein